MAFAKDLKTFLPPLAFFCNTIIGVGIFSLPWLASQVGVSVMLAYFLVLGSIVTIIHLMFADIALQTPDYKRLPGFARMYLGKPGEYAALGCTIIGILSALVGFIIIGGDFLYTLLFPVFGGTPLVYGAIYFLLGALFLFFGTSFVVRFELWGMLLFFSVLVALAAQGMPYFHAANLFTFNREASLFLPYGAVLFAMWGASSIPEIEEILGRKKRKDLLKPVIAASFAISFFAYASFTVLILGITGSATTESAFLGLQRIFSDGLVTLCFLFGLITSFTSFVIIGLTLKKILAYDLRLDKTVSWGVTAIIPFVVYLAGVKSFLAVFSFVGGILLGLDGIIVLLMYRKIHSGTRVVYPLILLFALAIFFEIVQMAG
jgi:amino acid permease